MQLKTFSIACLSFLILGNSSCQSARNRIDAFECILITVDKVGEERPLNQWYWFCQNRKTKEQKSIWLKDSTKCIREPQKPCKWYGTDVLELDKITKGLERSQR